MFIFDLFRIRKRIKAPWEKYYTLKDKKLRIPDITIYDQVVKSAKKYPKYRAIRYFNTIINFEKLVKKIDRTAVCYSNLGIKKGDIVTICSPNIPEALISVYALNKIGAIASMLHPLSAEEEIKDSLNSTNSSYLLTLDIFYEKVSNIIDDTKVKKVLMTSASDSMGILLKLGYKITQMGKVKSYRKNKKFLSWKKFLRKYYYNKDMKFKKFGKNTPAVILQSGGTSGNPKNVVIQNRAFILGSMQEKIQLKRLVPGDSALAIMPNFHGFGLSVSMHSPLALGCYTILVPQFNAKTIDTLFKKYNPSCILAVPTLFEALTNSNNVKNLDLSNLKYVVSGGDLLPKNLEDKINNYLKEHGCDSKISQGYGLSEALAAVTLACDDVNKSGSVGIPLCTNHIKAIDPNTRKALPANEVGELCIHSKALMMGYLNNESETNSALQIHEDGHIWLHTGDLGYLDKDGFVFIKGRLKRMIITSGYNVYPSHIEEVIEKHPAVLQCTVVGLPHPYKQQIPKAFIVLKEGYYDTKKLKEEIKEYCKKNLAKYMVPYEFEYRKKLPRTKLGKVDFRKLQGEVASNEK